MYKDRVIDAHAVLLCAEHPTNIEKNMLGRKTLQ
jgi:hypothetical protein